MKFKDYLEEIEIDNYDEELLEGLRQVAKSVFGKEVKALPVQWDTTGLGKNAKIFIEQIQSAKTRSQLKSIVNKLSVFVEKDLMSVDDLSILQSAIINRSRTMGVVGKIF
ncbi:MAG: hypothetical protein ACOC56_01650 [Atribacterota bacterium]